MKKYFLYMLTFIFLIIVIKFYISDYNIFYNVGDFDINEKSIDKYMYFEVAYKDNVYNYIFKSGRKMFKKRLYDVDIEEKDGYTCLTPKIKGLDGYSICNKDGKMVTYQVAMNEDNNIKNDKDFVVYENLDEYEHVYIWKYDGFYYLNDEGYKSINIFKKDRYSNDLMVKINGKIIFPNYDDNYLFSDFVVVDMSTGDYKTITSKYKINYDSYIVGNRKSSVFLFDNKELKLYEINYKKNYVEVVGDQNKGFIKYVDGKKKDADISEYVKDKITYLSKEDMLISIDNNYLSYKVNPELKLNFFNKSIDNINVIDDSVYFIYDDMLYRYKLGKADKIAYYFEFNFNKDNTIFVYNN